MFEQIGALLTEFLSSKQVNAIIVVFILSVPALWLGRVAFSSTIGKKEATLYASCWLLVSLSSLAIGDFWAYLGFLSLCILIFSKKTSLSGLKLFMLLVCAVPFFEKDIPGIGPLERLFSLNHYKVLALLILLPLAWTSRPESNATFRKYIDVMVTTLFLLTAILVMRVTTPTDTIRLGLDLLLVMYLPYIAMSRAVASVRDIREIMVAYTLPFLAISLIGVFEYWKGWHVYDTPHTLWAIEWSDYGYLFRFDHLRAYVSVSGGPIVFAYCILIAMGFLLAFWRRSMPVIYALVLYAILIFGLLSSQSRGPMIGVFVMVLVFFFSSRKHLKMGLQFMILGLVALPLLFLSPLGQKILSKVSPGASEESANIDYRAQLLDTSMIVIGRNPIFGSADFVDQLAALGMVQGDGIVDVVNTYLQVALSTGLVGLTLFIGIFLLILVRLFRILQMLPPDEDELEQIGRALLATLVGLLITIFTVSSMGQIPMLYWALAGLAVSYERVACKKVVLQDDRAVITPAYSAAM